MSHRRNANNTNNKSSPTVVVSEPPTIVKGPLSLDTAPSTTLTTSSTISMEEKVPLTSDLGMGGVEEGMKNSNNNSSATTTKTSKTSERLKRWKESAFAVGLTEPTWEAERQHHYEKRGKSRRRRSKFDDNNNNDDDPIMFASDDDNEEDDDNGIYRLPKDTTGCLCCSAFLCPYFGAGRVGNMVVLHSSMEWVEEVEEDEETGEQKSMRYTRPKLNWVLGPFWPMLLCVTYPLIIFVSCWAFTVAFLPGKKHPLFLLAWLCLTFGLIIALAFTGCRDPGIMYRYAKPPPQFENQWRWSDQAQTYRPRSAFFDSDTAVVVEEFDHTCPWTGTAIGKSNMFPFQVFVCLVFLCLIVDIFLITGAL